MEPLGAMNIPSFLSKKIDVFCINNYFGWYYFSANIFKPAMDTIKVLNPDKPWILTEFGAGAKRKSGLPPNKKFSEEYQNKVISTHILQISKMSYMAGWIIWIYRDFKSHMRNEEFQQGFNRKGIVDENNKKKIIAKRLPYLIKRFNDEKEIYKENRIILSIFKVILNPFFNLAARIFSFLLQVYSDVGDQYYTSKIDEH